MIPHSSPWINNSDQHAIEKLFSSKMIADGKQVRSLESNLCELFNFDNFLFTSNGSSALYFILTGLEFLPKDEVIFPSYVCESILSAVQAAGATPVICDIEKYWLTSPEKIAEKISKKTRAVIIPQLFGIHIDIQKFRQLGIIIINDLCQNFDAAYNTKEDRGDFVFFSFHATKCLTSGQGGGFSILNENLPFNHKKVQSYIDLFQQFTDVQASLLASQLKRYPAFISRRKKIADIYFDMVPAELTCHTPKEGNSFYRFPLIMLVADFDRMAALFMREEVMVRRGVDDLLHRKMGLADSAFPNAVACYNRTLSLPIYPALKNRSARKISKICQQLM